jgi:hypothetical protein
MAQDMGDFDRGMALLKRGLEQNPERWEFPFEMGFLYYTVARNDALAARYFALAARMPGSSDLTRRFAAFVYGKDGHRETSIRMWEAIARDAEEPYMRELAKHYLEKLRRGQRIDRKEPADVKTPSANKDARDDI